MFRLLQSCAALAALLPASAFACSCFVGSAFEAADNTDNVFWVRVTEIEVLSPGEEYIPVAPNSGRSPVFRPGSIAAYFEVMDTLKGRSDTLVYLRAQDKPMGSMCGTTIRLDEELLVFFNDDYSGNNIDYLSLSLCSHTRAFSRYDHYQALRKYLNHEQPGYYSGLLTLDGGRLKLQSEDATRFVSHPQGDNMLPDVAKTFSEMHRNNRPIQVELEGFELEDGSIYLYRILSASATELR